jgi:hypothetical protein
MLSPRTIIHSSPIHHSPLFLSRRVICLPTNPQHFTGPRRTSPDIQLFNQSINTATPRLACFCPAPYFDMPVIQLSSSVAERTYLFLTCWLASRAVQEGKSGRRNAYHRKLTSDSALCYLSPRKVRPKGCCKRSVLRLLQNNLASVGYTNWVRPVRSRPYVCIWPVLSSHSPLLSCPVHPLHSRLTPHASPLLSPRFRELQLTTYVPHWLNWLVFPRLALGSGLQFRKAMSCIKGS